MDIDIEVLFEDVFSGSLVLEKIHLRGEVISEVEIALPFSEDGESGFDLELHRGGCAVSPGMRGRDISDFVIVEGAPCMVRDFSVELLDSIFSVDWVIFIVGDSSEFTLQGSSVIIKFIEIFDGDISPVADLDSFF